MWRRLQVAVDMGVVVAAVPVSRVPVQVRKDDWWEIEVRGQDDRGGN